MTITITITHQQGEALEEVYTRLLAFAARSPNTAALLDITPLHQERVAQVLDQISKTQPKDGRNLYIVSRNVRPAHQRNSSDYSTPKDANPGATLANS